MYIGQNTLRDASVEFVRELRTNYARRIAQPFQTRTQPRGSRLRACQKDFFDKLKGDAERRLLFCCRCASGTPGTAADPASVAANAHSRWERKADAACILGSGADISTSDSRHKKSRKKGEKRVDKRGPGW